jgi:dienelactone hydrolase
MTSLGTLSAALVSLAALAQLPDGVEKHEVTSDEFVADFYMTPDAPASVAVLLLGGSEGGKSEHRAQALASEGFPVLAVAYFKAEGTPDYLDMVPLEYFDGPIEWLASQKVVLDGKMVVVGSSKGGELALLLASRHPQLAGAIGISPSSVVFQGIPKVFWPPRSSWSDHGKPVPFVPYDYTQPVDPQELLPLYERTLEQTDAVESAAIPVERINGPVLLLSGIDDTIWPATDMCDDIMTRLRANDFSHQSRHVDYEDAGHTLNEFFMLGGTKEGNRQARVDSHTRIVRFLRDVESTSTAEKN